MMMMVVVRVAVLVMMMTMIRRWVPGSKANVVVEGAYDVDEFDGVYGGVIDVADDDDDDDDDDGICSSVAILLSIDKFGATAVRSNYKQGS